MSEAVRRWRSDEINRKVEQKKKILAEVPIIWKEREYEDDEEV